MLPAEARSRPSKSGSPSERDEALGDGAPRDANGASCTHAGTTPAVLDRVRHITGGDGTNTGRDFRQRVRDLIVIASSSRGGSSLLASVIRRSGRGLMFQGECEPFLRLAYLRFPDTESGSDALTEEVAADLAWLEVALARDLGVRTAEMSTGGVQDVERRLALQWPTQSFESGDVARWVQCSLEASPTGAADARGFSIRLLREARRDLPAINPYAYDLPQDLVAAEFPDAPFPPGHPASPLIEEPPFILMTPWRAATVSEMETSPLVLQGPSNVYRWGFWSSFFPNARVRMLHLTRNPAAAINGLMDGWLHHGFHSHELPVGTLRIDGYSHLDGGDRWWKFDLPPGWRDFVSRPLSEVCAFQWISACQASLDYLERSGIGADPRQYLAVRFEDLLGDPEVRRRTIDRVFTFIDPTNANMPISVEYPHVMVTTAPELRRWKARISDLDPVLQQPAVKNLVQRLGYPRDPAEWS